MSLLLAALAALALLAISEVGYRKSNRALAEIRHAQRTGVAASALLLGVLDAETGQRGFLLTGESSYRAPYDTAVAQVQANVGLLRQLIADRPDQAGIVAMLEKQVGQKLAELAEGVRLRESAPFDASRSAVNTDEGRAAMESIRGDAAQLISASSGAIIAGEAQIAQTLRAARIGIALVTLAALAAFYFYLRQSQALQVIGQRQQEALQRERETLEGLVQQRTTSLARLATQLQQVRETERAHIARELHDELGSLLTAAKLDAARLKSRIAQMPEAIQRLTHLTELLNDGIALKRRIIEDLRPSSLSNLGLVASLEILGREFAENAPVTVNLELEPVALSEESQLTVYRMVQESLTNIAKHASAEKATVTLSSEDGQVIVEVTDDGVGFHVDRLGFASQGLAGMQHRVEASGGRLNIDSRPGAGTRLRAVLAEDA